MRTIKFRGYDTADHAREWVTFTLDDLLSGSDDYELIDPDTVAQLVGYDANGKEVYDDDELIDQDGLEYTISDVVQVELFCGGVYEPLYSNRYKFTLKEADQ